MNVSARPLVAAVTAVTLIIACGDVPTLDMGIAYISPIVLPAPAVAAGDTLRDSLGRAAPLGVTAFDRNDAAISGVDASFLVTSLPAGVTIDAAGRVVALDSLRTVQIIARIGDRLQTSTAQLEVVPQPDSLTRSGTIDSLKALTQSSALQVNVSGVRGGTRVPVKGIVVRYRIANLYPARTVDPAVVFFTNGLKTDLTRAVDTTTTSPGSASKTITMTTTAGVDSVAVEASANNLRGQPLKGSPVRFVIPIKRGA